MIDQERRIEQQCPPKGVESDERRARRPAAHIPDRSSERFPVEEQSDHRQRAHQHVRAALGGLGDDPRPPALERGARHAAVLQAERQQQPHIDGQRLHEGAARDTVEHRRGQETADEAEAIYEDDQGHGIAEDPVDEDSDP